MMIVNMKTHEAIFIALFSVCAIWLAIVATEEEKEPSVLWSTYSPAVKEKLVSYVSNKDCAGLQRAFDSAAANSTAHKRLTGHGNGDLMDYIIYHARKSGC